MLKSLNIRNFAVIDQMHVNFGRGLNVLTGETGSGKSIIVDALALILGGRSSAVQIRTGETQASIEAVFEVGDGRGQGLAEVLNEIGVEKALELIIRREIFSTGKSRMSINQRSVPAAILKRLQPFLADIYGQGEQRSLLSRQSHRELLDELGECGPFRQNINKIFQRVKSVEQELEQVVGELAEQERSGDLTQHQLAEIDSIGPRSGEDEELLAERSILAHAERIVELGSKAYHELYESDESILVRLTLIRRQLEELGGFVGNAGVALDSLFSGIASLTDVAETLRSYGDGLEYSPARLAEVESRLAELERVKRKYGTDLDGILKIRGELDAKVSTAGELAERIDTLRSELEASRRDYIENATKLTACRRKASPVLEQRVSEGLRHVAMGKAEFLVAIETAESEDEETEQEDAGSTEIAAGGSSDSTFFTPYGADSVEFLLSANPGESPRPLSSVASGGELSRLMLILRTAIQEDAVLDTIVFDEIDVGIGGRVAEAVGQRLKSLSARRQVFCVTHQPQIAKFADHHFMVAKKVERGRTVTAVSELAKEERVDELSRMIGGDEKAEKTREAARWLLENTQRGGQTRTRGSGKT